MSLLYFERVRERISELRWLIKRENTDVEWDEVDFCNTPNHMLFSMLCSI
jgi:hypothetical protein